MKLKEKNYQIILFSNSCCLIKNKLDKELLKYVDNIFYSYDIGYTKSETESYRYIEHKLGVKPNEILHIGDNLKSDYYNPIKNGWSALYYGNINDKNIKSIKELKDLIIIL